MEASWQLEVIQSSWESKHIPFEEFKAFFEERSGSKVKPSEKKSEKKSEGKKAEPKHEAKAEPKAESKPAEGPSNAPVFCAECGFKNSAGAKFCQGCGKPLTVAAAPTEKPKAQAKEAPKEAPAKEGKNLVRCPDCGEMVEPMKPSNRCPDCGEKIPVDGDVPY
jgi:DNA-directed RNA polymerase subunit RPC12/RpoP